MFLNANGLFKVQTKKYYRGREVFFDFNLKDFTGHGGKTFRGFKSIKEFLEKNPAKIILIGLSDNWTTNKKEGVRKPNDSLHKIEFLTYTDLLQRGEALVESALKTYVV